MPSHCAEDVSQVDSASALVSKTLKRFGAFDVLVNNAAINKAAPLDQVTEKSFDEHFAAKCHIGAVHVAGGRPRIQARGGHHQYQLAQLPLSEGHLYSATKAALELLTISLSRQPRGIRVVAVAPGMVDAQMLRANNKPEALNAMIDRNVLRRIGKADEIAAVVAFLATDDAGFLTGETVHVNGGQRL